jgi:uncharacterized protein (TIGR02246 family)
MEPAPSGARRHLQHLAIGTAVLLCMTSPAYGQASLVSPRNEIQQAVRAYVDAANKGDFSSFADMYSRQGGTTSVGDGKITRGWDNVRQDIDQHLNLAGKFSIGLGSLDIALLGPAYALAVAKFNVTVGPGNGQQVQRTGAMTLLFQKSGGEWKIIHDHTSMEAEDAAAIPVAATVKPATTTLPIADGQAMEIRPGSYVYTSFEVPVGTCEITGRITGISGDNRDFEAFITNDDGLQNWASGQQARVFWQSGRVVVTSIENAFVVGPGTFHLVMSNRFAGVPKTVQSQAVARCS